MENRSFPSYDSTPAISDLTCFRHRHPDMTERMKLEEDDLFDLCHPADEATAPGPIFGSGRVEVSLGDLDEDFDLRDESWVADRKVIDNLIASGQDQLLKLDPVDFVAGQWAVTKDQQEFYRSELGAGPMVMDWVENGYRVPFDSYPEQKLYARNNRSARERPDFVSGMIKEWLDCGVIRRTKGNVPPMICNPLSAVMSNKWRLVFDCRLLNTYVTKRKVQLEDHREIADLIQPGDHGFCEDFKSGYWQVRLREDQRTFFGCEWQGVYYEANVLILGVTDAVFAFTKIVRPVTRYLRKLGLRILSYIDDILILCCLFSEAVQARKLLFITLVKCGWLVNLAKSKDISTIPLFLGLDMDTISMTFQIPEKKLVAFLDRLVELLSASEVKKRQLASVVGSLMSFWRALGPVVRLRTRQIYALIHTVDQQWDEMLPLTEAVLTELRFWQNSIRQLNGFPFDNKSRSVTPTYIKAGDASDKGVYLALVKGGCETLLSKEFTPDQAVKSSTWRECYVLDQHYCSPLAERFRDSRIRHFSDNQGVPRIFEIGSPTSELQAMAERVYERCRQLNIGLEVVWARRDTPVMVMADKGSRGPWFYNDDFTLDFVTAENIVSRGITLDGFASYNNKLCTRYFSRGYEIEALGQDFFQQSWSKDEIVLIHPHPKMLIPALSHAHQFGAKMVVVLHMWRNLHSTFLLMRGGHLPKLAKAALICRPNFKGGEKSPAFWGVRSFDTVIFELTLDPRLPFNQQLVLTTGLDSCMHQGCRICLS